MYLRLSQIVVIPEEESPLYCLSGFLYRIDYTSGPSNQNEFPLRNRNVVCVFIQPVVLYAYSLLALKFHKFHRYCSFAHALWGLYAPFLPRIRIDSPTSFSICHHHVKSLSRPFLCPFSFPIPSFSLFPSCPCKSRSIHSFFPSNAANMDFC